VYHTWLLASFTIDNHCSSVPIALFLESPSMLQVSLPRVQSN